MFEESGVPAVDGFIAGEPFGTLDNYTLYKRGVPIDMVSVPSSSWLSLVLSLEARKPDRRSSWTIVLYESIGGAAVEHTAIFDTLAARFNAIDAAFVVGQLGMTTRAALIRKRDTKAFPDLSITAMSHSTWNFTKGNAVHYRNIVLDFAHCCINSRTNLEITGVEPGTHSIEQIMVATAHLSKPDLRVLRASILVKPNDQRTDSDRALLRVWAEIPEIRKDREPLGDSNLFWKVNKPPMNIAPRRFFRTSYDAVNEQGLPLLDDYGMQVSTKMVGRRLIGQNEAGVQEYMECDLEHLLDHPELLREHAVVFMGSDSTTGYGKSTIARFLACKFAVHMTTVLNRPKSEATVLGTTTLDDLSGVVSKSGWAVLFDELAIGDKDAIQYMSATILKTLSDPQSTAGARARGTNVRLAGDTARIFTTNATSLEDWAAGRFVVTLPIKRKMWVFVIKHKMIEDEWAKRNDYVGSELF